MVAGFAPVLKDYRIRRVWGDGYAGEWPVDRFRQHGIAYETAPLTKSELFIETLPLFTSGRVELLDHDRLLAQLLSLDRRITRSGRDSIGKPRNGYDDVATNAGTVDPAAGYRNGWGKPRRLSLSSGTITVRRPRVRGLTERFESRLLPGVQATDRGSRPASARAVPCTSAGTAGHRRRTPA